MSIQYRPPSALHAHLQSQSQSQSTNPQTIASLPSYPSSFSADSDSVDSGSESGDTEAEMEAMIQEEWEESLKQLEIVISIILIPFFGKWFGRQWAYWAYARYQRVGLGRPFFGISP